MADRPNRGRSVFSPIRGFSILPRLGVRCVRRAQCAAPSGCFQAPNELVALKSSGISSPFDAPTDHPGRLRRPSLPSLSHPNEMQLI